MNSLERLERGGGEFALLVGGERIDIPSPVDRHFQWVLYCLDMQHVPGTPNGLPEWKRALVFERWCAAYDLPNFNDARRLAYLLDHYRSAANNDVAVYANQDLGDLWRARRWTFLIDILDHLPAHSWFSASVSMDEEHAEMMAESLAAREKAGEEQEDRGPSLINWTPEVSALTSVLDAVNHVAYSVVAVQAGDKAGKPPKPAPRPQTALERAMKRREFDRRTAKHNALVARLLPNQGQGEPPVH